jgi:hypothetical protein
MVINIVSLGLVLPKYYAITVIIITIRIIIIIAIMSKLTWLQSC